MYYVYVKQWMKEYNATFWRNILTDKWVYAGTHTQMYHINNSPDNDATYCNLIHDLHLFKKEKHHCSLQYKRGKYLPWVFCWNPGLMFIWETKTVSRETYSLIILLCVIHKHAHIYDHMYTGISSQYTHTRARVMIITTIMLLKITMLTTKCQI